MRRLRSLFSLVCHPVPGWLAGWALVTWGIAELAPFGLRGLWFGATASAAVWKISAGVGLLGLAGIRPALDILWYGLRWLDPKEESKR